MDAVIFDIDGTLLESNRIDGELFNFALREVLGQVKIRNSWGAYTHVTDDGILEEVLLDNKIEPSELIIQKVKALFFEALSNHISSRGAFCEIPGARSFIERLQQSGSAVAYATGGWSVSAKMKLQSAEFPLLGIPLATSDESKIRVSIMRIALKQLGSGFNEVTYYGDGGWDRDAARELGWKFELVGESLGGLTQYVATNV